MKYPMRACFKTICLGLPGLGLLFIAGCACTPISVVKLSDKDRTMVERVLVKLNPLITERKSKGDIAALTFEELYAPLDGEERTFLRRFQGVDTSQLNISIPYRGTPSKAPELVVIRGQVIKTAKNESREIPPQFLPKDVYDAYLLLSENMKKDIGRTVYIESGYRSAAYQLHLFLFYLKNHNYSIRETARSVAWPGYSEHGWPGNQAVDFVNEQGIDGQDKPETFEALEEYQWLLCHAEQYGFELSYPRDSKMAFEPWHWRYKGTMGMVNDK